MLLEQSDERVTSRASVQPQRLGKWSVKITIISPRDSAYQWLLCRILSSLKEPEEHVGGWVEADVAGIVVNTFGSLTHTCFTRLFVRDLSTCGRCNCRDASRISGHLALLDERCAGAGQRRSRQDGGELCEARHVGKLVGEKSNQDFSKCLPS
jgi:hypothetical protein